MKLYEAYKNRLAVADQVFGKAHEGAKMDSNRKLVVAKVLENTNRLLNEAFDASQGTQRSDLGLYKKFTLNLTTVALPNLIAHDLVIVHPMSSMSGYITYIEYQYGVTKGGINAGERISSPFGFDTPDTDYAAKAEYTGARVVEDVTLVANATTVDVTPLWGSKTVDARSDNPKRQAETNSVLIEVVKVGDKVYKVGETADATHFTVAPKVGAEGTFTITFASAPVTEDTAAKYGYVYDNIVIPQDKIPSVRAEMKSVALVARARRIAVYYSQIAAYQAKTDYGVDLGAQLAEKAVGELSYEIDTECINLLNSIADEKPELTFSKTLPVGVSRREHYDGFSEYIEIAKSMVYNATKRFVPNYMVCAADVLTVLSLNSQWKPVNTGLVNGPYMAGTFGPLKVFVSPALAKGEYFIGVNGSDLMSSAAVYAPYMAIVPTQLLQFADGGTSQGFSTLYDLKPLNTREVNGKTISNLIVKGVVTD